MPIIKCRKCGKILKSMGTYHICISNNKVKWKSTVRNTYVPIRTKKQIEESRLKCFETRRHKRLIRKKKDEKEI